jgi:hypothetical protein
MHPSTRPLIVQLAHAGLVRQGLPWLPGPVLDGHALYHQIVAGLLGRLAGAPRPFRSSAPHSSLFGAQRVLEAVPCR